GAWASAGAGLDPLAEAEGPFLYGCALHNMALSKLSAGGGADPAAARRGMELERDIASWEMSTVPAFWARNLDQLELASTRFEDLRAFREQGDEASMCGIMAHLALVEAMRGTIDRARALADAAVELAVQTGQD